MLCLQLHNHQALVDFTFLPKKHDVNMTLAYFMYYQI